MRYKNKRTNSEISNIKRSNTLKGHFVSEETRKKQSDAKKGKPSCNKGNPHTEGSLKKISESNIGKKRSEETRRKMGEARKGKTHSPETRKKLSDAAKEQWENSEIRTNMCDKMRANQKPWSEERRIKQSELLKKNPLKHWLGKKRPPQSEEMKRKWRETRSKLPKEKLQEIKKKISDSSKERCGEKSHMWKGGVSFEPYCYKFNKRRKKACRNFFDNICICCGKHVIENILHWGTIYKQIELSVHHIDHDKEQGCNGKPFNLVTMCIKCHTKEIYNHEEYKQYINKTLREGFKWGIWNEQEYIEKVMY